MSKREEMFGDYEIPRVCQVRQKFDRTVLTEPEQRIRELWNTKGCVIKPGERIAIAGGIPFIVPAMGSHGGGTANNIQHGCG